MNAYKTLAMNEFLNQFSGKVLGFMCGIITLVNSTPKPILSSIGGALFVAALIAFFSHLGTKAGALVWDKAVTKYNNYKSKKIKK